MNIQTQAEILWNNYKKLFPELKGDCPKIILSNRLKKTAGYNQSEYNTVTLANRFLASHREDMLNITLPHELAHQIDYNLFGVNKRHHNNNWATIMMIIGLDPDPYHHMLES